ncbi:xyloside xylosyltransferase 1-like [Clavelina lepadiformis]|uniref:xyloside xylosyltransferase 1-like n=1 Tax=Clavelina lepadiformis TaxID=159417 RepID=UPI004042EA10
MPQRKQVTKPSSMIFRLTSSKPMQVLLVAAAITTVFLFYKFATSGEDFLSQSRAAYHAESKMGIKDGKSSSQAALHEIYPDDTFEEKHAKVSKNQAIKHAQEFENDFHLLFLFTRLKEHPKLKEKFNTAFGSLFSLAKFHDDEVLHIHFICDENGRTYVEDYLQQHIDHPEFKLKVHFHNINTLGDQLLAEVGKFKSLLGKDGKNNAYYDDALFYLSLVIHKILPQNVHRLVQVDLDLKFMVNIREIWDEFSYFTHENIIGIAYENQPVYRNVLWKYRRENPGTKFGSQLPDGNPGFNSGVLLLHLDHLRSSKVYNSYLDNKVMGQLVQKYSFQGHLGDQDFFTLLSFERSELFFILDCGWNKQLCEWWRNKGFEDVFDYYFKCGETVKIWHGNCNTPFPKE